MAQRQSLCLALVLSLLANAFSAPTDTMRWRYRTIDNDLDPMDTPTSTAVAKKRDSDSDNDKATTYYTRSTLGPDDDDDDDDFDEPMQPASTGGSNIFSLFRLASALLPGLSGGDNPIFQNMLRDLTMYNNRYIERHIMRRQYVGDNEIDIDYTTDLKPPLPTFQRQESDENSERESSESDEEDDNNDSENDAEVLSSENDSEGNDNSDSNGDDSDNDSDEPPGGDGQGGGILGLLAGLSGGEDGQSDLGSLLATLGGIVANLSGDGIDLNSLIATGIGLFAGLLSEGEENPGAVIASYLLTSLDTITGGGAQNNGAFFGNLVSKLVKGTSAAGDPNASSEENGNNMPMADSGSFFISLIMSLLGDMSKTSSGGSS